LVIVTVISTSRKSFWLALLDLTYWFCGHIFTLGDQLQCGDISDTTQCAGKYITYISRGRTLQRLHMLAMKWSYVAMKWEA